MPIEREFGGHGRRVMAQLKSKHGSEEGERIFFATLNKRKKKRRVKQRLLGANV
jgi:hypothetical protein